MEKARILEQLIKEAGYSLKSFSAKCGLPYTTVYGIIKNGVGKASVDNVLVICRNLGITVEQLEEMANGISEPSFENMETIIARNGKNITPEQKMKLIQLLSSLKD